MRKTKGSVDYDKLYARYVRDYHKKQNEGYTMADMMTKEGFKQVYQDELRMRHEEIALGERKVIGNPVRDIVNAEVDSVTWKQAQKLAKASKALGDKKSASEIRKDKAVAEEITDKIKDHYNELKQLGLAGKEIKELIGRDFFGSPS